MKIGICVIAYNRLTALKRVLCSLEAAIYDEQVTLIISIDKSDTNIVSDYADSYLWANGDKRVITHETNLGLRRHVLLCGELLHEFDALVVLEDDISVAPSFYLYAKQCAVRFETDDRIAGISLYNFPLNYHNNLPFYPLHSDSDVYLMQCAQSWGQVWLKRQWFAFKTWYEENSEEFGLLSHLPVSICSWPKSSWLKYHTRYCIEQGKYFVYPYVSLSTNHSDAGTHNKYNSTLFQSSLLYGEKKLFNLTPSVRYDGFFENELLYDLLQIDRDSLCIDFYGEKNNREGKRFWLTRKRLPYRLVKSYALSLKPYEWNVICENNGNELFLYDLSASGFNNREVKQSLFYSYMYGIKSEFIHLLRIRLDIMVKSLFVRRMKKIVKQRFVCFFK